MEHLPLHQAEERPRNLLGWLSGAPASPREPDVKGCTQLYLKRKRIKYAGQPDERR